MPGLPNAWFGKMLPCFSVSFCVVPCFSVLFKTVSVLFLGFRCWCRSPLLKAKFVQSNWFRVFPCFSWLLPCFPCCSLFFCVFPCFSKLFPCFSSFFRAFPCFSMQVLDCSSSAFPCGTLTVRFFAAVFGWPCGAHPQGAVIEMRAVCDPISRAARLNLWVSFRLRSRRPMASMQSTHRPRSVSQSRLCLTTLTEREIF